MSRQQKVIAHGQTREWQPLLYKRHGPAERQGNRLPPVPATRCVLLCTGAQLALKHLGHSETEELFKVQAYGDHTCRDILKGLGPYLRENRPIESTWRTSKWFSAHQKAAGIHRPAQQAARCKQLCPDDQEEEAMIRRVRKMREELEELRGKFYDERFRAIFSSLQKDQESSTESRCLLQDPPSSSVEAAAGPSTRHSACSVTKGAAAETPKLSELVSLDQLLAELGPASEDSLSCDALVKELLDNWEQEELPDTEDSGERDREPQSAFLHPVQDKEGCVLTDRPKVTPELAAGSQEPHSTAGVTKVSAGLAQNNTDMLAHLCSASGDWPACDALLNDLLEKWDQKELQDRAAAGLRDSEPENVLSLQRQEEEEETAPSPLDSSPCDEGHSEPLPTALPEDNELVAVCASPADAADEPDTAGMQAVCAQAISPEEKPCKEGALAGACPVTAPALAGTVPAGPAAMAPVPQPPAPRRWRSVAKAAQRALRQLLSFGCLRGQPEE